MINILVHTNGHFSTLVSRCTELKSLNLCFVKSITDDSVTEIIKYLRPCLEEIDLTLHEVTFAKILELKTMPKLRILNCRHLENREIEILRKQLPHVIINRKELHIGDSDSVYQEPEEGFFDIKCERLQMFDNHLD